MSFVSELKNSLPLVNQFIEKSPINNMDIFFEKGQRLSLNKNVEKQILEIKFFEFSSSKEALIEVKVPMNKLESFDFLETMKEEFEAIVTHYEMIINEF